MGLLALEEKQHERDFPCRSSFYRSTILLGDFNLHHPWWQPSTRRSPGAAEPFVIWLDSRGYSLKSQPDTPTHNGGNVLDLVIASAALAAKGTTADIHPDLDVTSDYMPVLTLVPWDSRFSRQNPFHTAQGSPMIATAGH